ncbi:LexA-binding, inner membrane-associated putative hydrolase [Thermoactinomyces sp. DSM 45891]|uniref:metal-dependent hydrolase n=1 Tax=Thermoactinomyces sp. DSM 45891 TaxID=1761907 RepID=UPI00091574B2|nr:metal-dependent hydrolase [Thermoactinomyces sp. DSM 45891]SFX76930.1 LexA-binding, inner membrane-associated putative hydrolase [Thermoactinomyces sp. DSM 45891]
MTGKTHLSVGALFGVGYATVNGDGSQDWLTICIGIAVATLSSMLPDLDHKGSYISKYVTLNLKTRYRAIFASLIGFLLIAACFYFNGPLWIALTGLYVVIAAYVPHRSFTHSLMGVGLVGMISFLALPNQVYFEYFMAGYLSHLFADALTVSGIPLFWPNKTGFRLARIKTNTRWDIIIRYVSGIFTVIGLGYLVLH